MTSPERSEQSSLERSEQSSPERSEQSSLERSEQSGASRPAGEGRFWSYAVGIFVALLSMPPLLVAELGNGLALGIAVVLGLAAQAIVLVVRRNRVGRGLPPGIRGALPAFWIGAVGLLFVLSQLSRIGSTAGSKLIGFGALAAGPVIGLLGFAILRLIRRGR